MPNNAPDVTGTATGKQVSYHFIDSSGDKRTVSVRVGATATNAQIQALADALGDASNASLYEVSITNLYGVVPVTGDAVDASRPSAYSNIVLLYKNPAGDSANLFIPAPIEAMFDAGSDNPNLGATELTAVDSAGMALIATRYSGVTAVSARYTERTEINSKVAF